MDKHQRGMYRDEFLSLGSFVEKCYNGIVALLTEKKKLSFPRIFKPIIIPKLRLVN